MLCSIFTVHIPNCVIVVLLYVYNWIFVFLVAANCSSVTKGNIFFCFCICVMVLCSLYHLYPFYMVPLFQHALMMFSDLPVLLNICYWNWYNLFHCVNQIFLFLFLVWFLIYIMDHSILCTSADLSEIVHLAAFCALLPTSRHCLGGWLEPRYLQFCLVGILACLCGFFLILSLLTSHCCYPGTFLCFI